MYRIKLQPTDFVKSASPDFFIDSHISSSYWTYRSSLPRPFNDVLNLLRVLLGDTPAEISSYNTIPSILINMQTPI